MPVGGQVRQFRKSRGRRMGDAVISMFGRAGIGPFHLLYTIRELPAAEAGPIRKRYIGIAGATRPFFQASKDSPADDFIAEADRHPVFALTPVIEDRP